MDDAHIRKLRDEVENHLQWGSSANWGNYDFEKLSEAIAEKTNVRLSISTLKRFFGKVKYDHAPSLTTLNALSEFIGYADWRDFGRETVPEKIPETKPGPAGQPLPAGKTGRRMARILVPAVLLLLLLVFIYTSFLGTPSYRPDDFSFSSRTMLTEGLPNSVVFDFDASKAGDRDSVFICQTWDTRRRVRVNKQDKHHSAIYYYPGYFRAKLFVNEHIVKTHDIQVRTDGWLGLVEAPWGERPLYFTKEEITRDSGIAVDQALLEQYHLSLFPDPPRIRFFNQDDLKGYMTNNFEFETAVRSTFFAGKNACQTVQILLQAKDDILILPLAAKACVGDLSLAAYGAYFESRSEDLSGFGCDMNDWVHVRIQCVEGKMTFYINDQQVFQTNILNVPAEIVGVQYRFEGMGAIQYTRLRSGDKVHVFK